LAQVDAYLASGQKAKVWAQANGVALRDLSSWCAHAGRWRARLGGADGGDVRLAAPSGFVAAQVARDAQSRSAREAIKIELSVGATAMTLHWPTSQSRELAAWLRELGR
jgi:hypothetical protein